MFEASRAAWDSLPWPETLLSIAWLASLDGQSALAYVQWRDESEFEAYGRTHRPILAARLKAAIPALGPAAPVFYRRYRSGTRPDAPEPGCVVVVSVEFDGPDEARQRAWVDAVFDAIESDPSPPAGGISGHFHVSSDGTRVLNYAEWVDEASHRAALEQSGIGAVGSGPSGAQCRPFRPEGQPRDALSAGSAPGAGGGRRCAVMSDARFRLAVIIGSTRVGRLGPAVAAWFADQASSRDDVDVDLIDPADLALPIGPRLAAADAFVVVTPEYNTASRRL